MRVEIETWDPSYGVPMLSTDKDDAGDVRSDVEVDTADWRAIDPNTENSVGVVAFVDGVQRMDASLWLSDENGNSRGLCATVSAGLVVCDTHKAEVREIFTERGLHTSANAHDLIVADLGCTYHFRATRDGSPRSLTMSVDRHMARLEDLASRSNQDCDLVVFDGPLSNRDDKIGVGFIKTQHVQYLEGNPAAIPEILKDRQRTPLFKIEGKQPRWSWYLRLPNPHGPQASGLVRCELPDVYDSVEAAVQRADAVSVVLPRFASAPHKEARAPQNLYPIAGLERQMRWRMGDRDLLERGLRKAAASIE